MATKKPLVEDGAGNIQRLQGSDLLEIPALAEGQILFCIENEPAPVYEAAHPLVNNDGAWLAGLDGKKIVVAPFFLPLTTDAGVDITDDFGNMVADVSYTERLLHSTRQIENGIHGIVAWEYADAAARALASGFSGYDVHKLAVDLDTDLLWRLSAVDPIWTEVGFDASGSEGFVRQSAIGVFTAIQSNLTAVVDPTTADNTGAGYAVGSEWFNVTGQSYFVCRDPDNPADWTQAA